MVMRKIFHLWLLQSLNNVNKNLGKNKNGER